MSSNIYTAGLQNAGSYRVSGQPFIKRQTINAGEEVKIEFPYVAKNVIVKIPNPPNKAVIGDPGQSRFMTADPGPSGGVYDLGSQNVPGGSSGGNFTISFWYKESQTWTSNGRILHLVRSNTRTADFRMKGSGTPNKYQWIGVAAGGSTTSGPPNGQTNWYRVTLTQLTGATTVYHDATSVHTYASNFDHFDDIQLPPNTTAAVTSSFDELMVFNSGMTQAQVDELHNSGEYFNPNRHSLSANLVTWHTGDDPRDGIDTGQKIHDLAGADQPFNLLSSGDNSFTTGPWTTQTTGKVRVHTLSTGSASGANIVSNNHFKELQGYGQSYSMPMKSKEIYISAVDAQVTVEIIAELTNIPTGRMYALTGSGIDE